MPKAPHLLLTSLALVASLAPAARAADEAVVMADATRILNQMAADPNTGVPLELLRRSEGVIVVPTMLNVQLRRRGRSSAGGVFLVRDSGKGQGGATR